MSQLLTDLRAVRLLLASPERWTKGCFARDASNTELDNSASENAVCWCLIGAMEKVAGAVGDAAYNRGSTEYERVGALMTAVTKSVHCGIVSWNDARERTHAEVLLALDEAIQREESHPNARG